MSRPRSPHRLATLIAASLLPAAAAGEPKPNVIVIIADDLGYADVGFNGCEDIPTPHIDRLAEGGVRCTNGYVSHPVCSPSRAGLMTGRYQQRFGHENNPPFVPLDEGVGLPVGQATIADALGEVGYTSAMVGKWHLGAAEPFHPLNRGFTHMYGFLGGGHQYFPDKLDVVKPTRHDQQYRTKLLRDRERVDEKEYLTDAFSREAVKFIDRCHETPFFLYLSYNAPHTPMQATEKYLNRFAHIKEEPRKTYAAMVSAMDDGVGEVLDAVSRHGLDERTLIIFLSDNGGPVGVNGSRNAPLRAGKGTVYEGGIRVPFVVRWTGHLPEGKDFDRAVSALDIFATCAVIAGVEEPAIRNLDGVNLVPYLSGEKDGDPHEALYWRTGGGDRYAVRIGPAKLVEQPEVKAEVFNLAQDVGEEQDHAPRQLELVTRLNRLRVDWGKNLLEPKWPNPQQYLRKQKE